MNINDISRQIERVTKNEDAGSWMQVLSPITVEPIPGARILLRGMHAPEVQQYIIDSKLREIPDTEYIPAAVALATIAVEGIDVDGDPVTPENIGDVYAKNEWLLVQAINHFHRRPNYLGE